MEKLTSEQLPNDGSFHVKRLLNEANGRLNQIGARGKRATIVAKKTSLSLQFTFKDGKTTQKNVGLGSIPVSAKGIEEAEKLAQMVTNQLMANQFNWDWFNNLIGKTAPEQNKQLTCKEMLEAYKKHYFKQGKNNKNPEGNWYKSSRHIDKVLNKLNKPLSLAVVRQIVEATENNTDARQKTLNGLVAFLKYFEIENYKKIVKEYKANNKVKHKKRNVPSDEKIIKTYKTGFIPSPKCTKKYLHRYAQWQFLYGLLAAYGLRIHEAWNIANWDKPVILKDGDWIEASIEDDNEILLQHKGSESTIPAILDPNNKKRILCIGHDTKTGYRMAIPISPRKCNWLEEFNLLQPLNLPDIENPLRRVGESQAGFDCTIKACMWFRLHKYGFTPHDLRHAYNHRGHYLGYNHKTLSDSLGHTIAMNQSGYLRHVSEEAKLQEMKEAISQEQNKRTEIEHLETKVKKLKAENEKLKLENEKLKTRIQQLELEDERLKLELNLRKN